MTDVGATIRQWPTVGNAVELRVPNSVGPLCAWAVVVCFVAPATGAPQARLPSP